MLLKPYPKIFEISQLISSPFKGRGNFLRHLKRLEINPQD
jgi:hypothetical protein